MWEMDGRSHCLSRPNADNQECSRVVSYRLNYHMFGSHEKFYPSLPNEVPASRQVEIWKSYIKLLLHLRDSGKQVVVVIQAPELNKRVGFKIFNADISSGDIISVPGRVVAT